MVWGLSKEHHTVTHFLVVKSRMPWMEHKALWMYFGSADCKLHVTLTNQFFEPLLICFVGDSHQMLPLLVLTN